ncbi:MAG: aminopeptidase [Verrucomicrobiales bacterium]|nr:aminopeptidase [Verrucomicrobiales bacterium]
MLLLSVTSCRTVGFYSQALRGQWQLQSQAQPIAQLRADSSTSKHLQDRLARVDEIRAFATSQLGLASEHQYERYTDLGRKHAVWVVFAAPEFSTQPHTWRYPLLGKLSYRGYFSESAAQKEAERLAAQGLETHVGGVNAYSTLGWFHDPVLNTFIDYQDADLAELLFHELTHQRIYFRGDTAFNEALATAVGEEGTRRWLEATGRETALRKYLANQKIGTEFAALLSQCRQDLAALYARKDLSADAMRQVKASRIRQLRTEAEALSRRYGHRVKVDRFFAKPVNNARLASLTTYFRLVPAFENLLRRCGGDLELFFSHIATQRSATPAQRRAWLRGFDLASD